MFSSLAAIRMIRSNPSYQFDPMKSYDEEILKGNGIEINEIYPINVLSSLHRS